MIVFRILLVFAFLVVLIYTGVAVSNEGIDLVTPALREIGALGWPGQFFLDFATYLLLSALWVAWRHQFTPAGIALGLIASVGGILFLSCYLLVVSFQVNGDIRKVLLGDQALD